MITEDLRVQSVRSFRWCLAFSLSVQGDPAGGLPPIRGSVVIHELFTLCLLSHRAGDERLLFLLPPPLPPPHYLLYLMGPSLSPSLSLSVSLFTFIYKCICFRPALRVTVFNIIGETWLLPLNAEITGAFFLSSPPLHFSCVAPRGRNIFISPCAPSFKTFTPAVWKIFLIFLPHGVEKSP